jgi:uncharacterized membrane protein
MTHFGDQVVVPLMGLFGAPQIDFPGGEVAILMVLRWIHLVAGITWMGLLYFFTLVNMPFLQELDAQSRGIVVPKLMPRALWWFRWSAVVTVLAGIAYWMHIVATDARSASVAGEAVSPGRMFGSFFALWTLAFAVEMGALMSPAEALRKGPGLGVIVAAAVIGASYVFLAVNQNGWESSRALAIGIGGGLGWFMLMNVWGIIWRMQKKMIRWIEANATQGTAMPPESAKVARLTMLCARVNFVLSFPMLFFMGAASHYAMFPGK